MKHTHTSIIKLKRSSLVQLHFAVESLDLLGGQFHPGTAHYRYYHWKHIDLSALDANSSLREFNEGALAGELNEFFF